MSNTDKKTKAILLAISSRQRDVQQLQEAHSELCLALVERPDDAELHGQIGRVEQEKSALEKDIERLQAAYGQAQVVDTAREAELLARQQKAAAKEAMRLAEERVKVAQMLDGTIAALVEALRTIHDLDEKIYAAVHGAGVNSALVRQSSGIEGYGAPLARALASTGLDSRLSGITVDAPGPAWKSHSCSETALLSHDRLRGLLQGGGSA